MDAESSLLSMLALNGLATLIPKHFCATFTNLSSLAVLIEQHRFAVRTDT